MLLLESKFALVRSQLKCMSNLGNFDTSNTITNGSEANKLHKVYKAQSDLSSLNMWLETAIL